MSKMENVARRTFATKLEQSGAWGMRQDAGGVPWGWGRQAAVGADAGAGNRLLAKLLKEKVII